MAAGLGPFAPLEVGLDQGQVIVRVVRRQCYRAIEMLLGLGAVANAQDRGRVAVEHAQITVRPAIINGLVELARDFVLLPHGADQLEGAQGLGPGHLGQVHGQVVVDRSRVRGRCQHPPARRQALLRDFRPLRPVRREFRQVEAGPAEFPGRLRIPGVALPPGAGFTENGPRVRGKPVRRGPGGGRRPGEGRRQDGMKKKQLRDCQHHDPHYNTNSVRLHLKYWRLVLIPAVVLVVVGCGGFSASRSVSPASFFLPGLMKADPPSPPVEWSPPVAVSTEMARVLNSSPMRFPLALTVKIARHIIKHKFLRTPRFALVLQLEPLHTCNLTCTGCGRIREYSTSLKDMMPLEDCLASARECDAPMVSICGGEPLIYPLVEELVAGLLGQGRIVYICTNGMGMRKKMRDYLASIYAGSWSRRWPACSPKSSSRRRTPKPSAKARPTVGP